MKTIELSDEDAEILMQLIVEKKNQIKLQEFAAKFNKALTIYRNIGEQCNDQITSQQTP